MFNPKLDFDLKTLWDKLGTFYAKLTPKGKEVVQSYWTALHEGLEGLYYDLYQANLASYLDKSDGYLEEGYQNYEVIWEGPGANVKKQDLPKGMMDAGLLKWGGTSGETMTGYYPLPDKGLYLSIPTLSGQNSGQVLYENVDYEIENFRQIKFLKPPTVYGGYQGPGSDSFGALSSDLESLQNLGYIIESGIDLNVRELPRRQTETFFSKQGLVLLPTINQLLIPAFGQESPEIILNSGYYPPFASGYRKGELTYFEERQAYARHLVKWSQAMLNYFKKSPTLENLTKVYATLQGFPFSYKHGVLESIDVDPEYGKGYDYLTIRTITNSVDYMSAGAKWSNDTETNVQGSYLYIKNNNGYPASSNHSSFGEIKANPQNVWIPIQSTECPTPVASDIYDTVAITLEGVPIRLTGSHGYNGGPWHPSLHYRSVQNGTNDSTSGEIDDSFNTYYHTAYPLLDQGIDGTKHSPLIGYALDGFPIYGPIGYRYIDAGNHRELKEHTSSYQLKTGTREAVSEEIETHVPAGNYNGKYIDDYEYVDSVGSLDEFNGIYSATPEYPDGVYHYVCTVSGVTPTFPYVLRKFKGLPNFERGLLKNKSIENLSEELIVYEIPTGGHYNYVPGDPIKKFDVLMSGITMFDYIKDGDVISGVIRASGTVQQFDVSVGTDFDGNKGFNIGSLSESIFFSGGVLTNADVNTVSDEAQGAGAYSEGEGGGY